jgi:hypothetical protein
MATFTEATISQGTYETRKWTADFSADIPTGGSITGGTAYHTPPTGSATTPTIAYTTSTVTAQLASLTTFGNHYLDIVATYSNGETSQLRIGFVVNFPATAGRSGMQNLLAELRGMCEAGASDYTIADVPYWSDAQLQDVMDTHRTDVVFEPLQSYPYQISGGSLSWTDYRSTHGYYEATTGGTAIFYIQDSTGATVSGSSYSTDYRRGVITFSANQAGTAYYLTGRSYDLDAAASDVWRRKASHYANSFDFSTDNHSVSRSQVYKHCLEMAEHFEGKSASAIETVQMFRSDME